MTYVSADADAATDQAISYLQAGLPADIVAALLQIRFGSHEPTYRARVAAELDYCRRVRADLADLLARGLISATSARDVDRDFEARLAALDTVDEPIRRAARATAPSAQPSAPAAAGPAAEAAAPAPPAPAAPGISLREIFAEHSVLILAALGAFLLVVATVLFELYGTVGLGGGVRLAAVVALNVIFASAGYLANRQERLRSVGSIYIALAAVLLPLVGIAAWTFLDLGARGVTVDQALAVTATACALSYGFLARRLGLRAYGDMAGAAVLVASWGLSGAIAGDHWRSIGLAVTPLVYAVWERLLPDRVFAHFKWFAHAVALVAIGAAFRFDPAGWVMTTTLAVLAVAYLAWQAVSADRIRARAGETALILAATTAIGPLGLSSYHYALPMLVAIPLVFLARVPDSLGVVGKLYRAHPAHLHLAVFLGLVLALAQYSFALGGEEWRFAIAFWIAFGLYALDFWLGRTTRTGYALRAALPFALLFTAQAWGLDLWTATLTAAALLVYVVPFVAGPALKPLTRRASFFFYAGLALVLVQLPGIPVGAGHWEIPAALLVSAVAIGAASEMGGVRFGAYAARAVFSLAWFGGVEALNAGAWRGPFDALLALFYVALGQLRTLATHSVATAGRRWFIHATGVVAIGLCFTGPDDQLWWRLTAASGALAVAYWWLATTRPEQEMPWLAWTALSAAAGSLALAWVPELWQGTVIVAAALLLTAVWAVARGALNRPLLHYAGLPVLGVLAAVGAGLTLRQEVPQWSQAIAALLAGGFLLAWSRLHTQSELVQSLRAGAAAIGTIGLFVGAAVLKIDAGYAGLLALAIAAGHAEWNVRVKGEIERWYAVAALLVMAPVIYLWPYAQTPAALIAVEFVALAAICVQAAVRRREWFLAFPAALLLAPALHVAFIALGLGANHELEERSLAVLAWIVGFVGLVVRTRFGSRWALSIEAGAATLASGALLALAADNHPDPAGIALLAYAVVVYAAGMQERQRWVLPAAAATALAGMITLLDAHGADTINYAAAVGVLGLIIWVAGRVALEFLGRHGVIDMHRYLGLGLLTVAGLAGFAFPDKTGPFSEGATLAALALLITGGVFWLDARTFGFRPNVYLALVSASTAGYFVARGVRLEEWKLVPPGLGLIACGIWLRQDKVFKVDPPVRQLVVGVGLGLVMGWAAAFTVSGDLFWLVALLIEGAITVGAGIVLRSRVLLAGGGVALALVSLRALLSVAQAGYLFAAFGAVALVLLAVATAIALSRGRSFAGARGMREQLATWD
ncbi:MAG TPA: hypothetical protein VF956_12855 [Candidatus Dormibacteraeota bacterium]